MPILMCKDIPVYNTNTKEVLNEDLLPVIKGREFNEKKFKRSRHFIGTNAASRQLDEGTPKDWIEKKRQFSLSDCYWYKYRGDDEVSFATHNPYTNDFISLASITHNSSMPAKTLTGSFTKEWFIAEDGSRCMRKSGLPQHIFAELFSYSFAKELGIPVNKVSLDLFKGAVIVENISDIDNMLLDFNLAHMNSPNYFLGEISQILIRDTLKQKSIDKLQKWKVTLNNLEENEEYDDSSQTINFVSSILNTLRNLDDLINRLSAK